MVRDQVLGYLRALVEASISIVFISNSGCLHAASIEALKPLCAAILIRRNIGYDFGAWRDALERLALPRPDTEMILLINDSVYGPLRPLREIFSKIDLKRANFWGLTESWQTRYHLQSYFAAFGPEVVASPAWARFWSTVRPVPSKHWVIRNYEIGLTQALLKAGFRCEAIWPYPGLIANVDAALLTGENAEEEDSGDPAVEVRRTHARRIRKAAVRRTPLNPTNELWRQLLLAGFPFIKRELLRDNPGEVADVADWRVIVEQQLKADVATIERDLQRSLRNRAP
ncbi:MAG: lipopolysaccharide biosynthesis protein [Acetobacteraceae bacterium]|nr:lipopolysaccharide biosynthesis protein [Acetobacteraceae bacterium]MBV8589530.1 lipopolysaccharide biosynthesis protein [Acetobacteraceae bacterium]